jgi:hypothetical protein
MLLSIHTPFQEPREPSARTGLLVEARQGLLWLWRTPFLWMSEVLIAGSNFVSNGLTLVLIVIAHERGARSAVIGVMLALVAAGGLLGAIGAPKLLRLVSPRLIVVGYSWVGVAVLFALVPTPPDARARGDLRALGLLRTTVGCDRYRLPARDDP